LRAACLVRDRFEGEAASARTEAADRRGDDRHHEGNMSHAMRPQRQIKTQSARLLSATELGGKPTFPEATVSEQVAPKLDISMKGFVLPLSTHRGIETHFY